MTRFTTGIGILDNGDTQVADWRCPLHRGLSGYTIKT